KVRRSIVRCVPPVRIEAAVTPPERIVVAVAEAVAVAEVHRRGDYVEVAVVLRPGGRGRERQDGCAEHRRETESAWVWQWFQGEVSGRPTATVTREWPGRDSH